MAGQFPDPTRFLERSQEILERADERNLTLRLLGALAFYIHCPKFNYIQTESQRYFTDIDFMAYIEEKTEIEKLFTEMGYKDDIRVRSVPHLKRSIFFSPDHEWHSDVFYDVLDFSHEIDFRGRLKIDYPTISLVDLLLEKMQIVQINEKDIIDTLMLLREHEIGGADDETINIDYLARVCKGNWGLWRTVTINLDKVERLLGDYEALTPDDGEIIRDRLQRILRRIEEEPPTMRWKLRSRIGERIKWYRDVDEHM
jgi:hypothetical protein